MTTKEIVLRYGTEHFYDEDGVHYIVYPKHLSKIEAMRAANMYFKVNSARLKVNKAYKAKDKLYFSRRDVMFLAQVEPVWAIEVV